ncbi:MAG: fibronectin type III domain-containing protein [Candidatus Pacebacteria bacterium]|jgi:hypothetical protein|nr:fibronectin type III domain-containing protein [Candidatus Paceibacterota bacterium]
MKKLLVTLLCLSIASPAFVYADNHKSEQNREHGSHKSEQKVQHVHIEMEDEDEDDEEHESSLHEEKENGHEGHHGNNGNPQATTTPADIAAPVISLLGSSAIATSSATISWTTNELATGDVYYSTSTPVVVATANNAGSTVLATAHSFNLAALLPGTTYYFMVKSVDVAGNATTSAAQSFSTGALPTPLVISNIANSNVASTTATVSWVTNRLATSNLSYGTTTASTVLNGTSTPALTHSFNLVGLIANTTYNLFLQSMDAIGNIAVATASLFTTN